MDHETRTDPAAAAHVWDGRPYGDPIAPWPTVVHALGGHAATRPSAPALTIAARAGGEETFTYGELWAAVGRQAAWLAGQGVDDVVALAPTTDAASIVTILALLYGGHPTLLLNPADPPARRAEQTAGAGAATVLRSPAAPAEIGAAVPDPRALTGPPADPSPGPPHGDALYIGTSGSTAASKLVAQSHHNAAVNAQAVIRHHGLAPGDPILGCLPVHHVNGLHFTVLGALAAGAHTVMADGFDPFAYAALLDRRPRIASVVPSILEALAATWRRRPPSGLDYFVSAAAPLPARTARDVHTTLGVPVLQGYGLTETTNFSATMPPDLDADLYRALALDCDVPSVGVDVWGGELAVLDEAGARLPHGRVGEVCARGHNVMNGYFGNPEATREAFRGGWFHTGDLGRRWVDERSGRVFTTLTGRLKNVAKVGGSAVSLEEMDRCLRAAPAVRDAACVTAPHPMLGEEVVAAVVLDDAGAVPGVREALARHFPAGVVPRRIQVVDAVPRTPTGKVLRADLSRRLGVT